MNSISLKNILDKLNAIGFCDTISCPYCHSKNIIKNGKYKLKQRYICKDCYKNFNSLTNSPIAMSHIPDKWPSFIECLVNGLSLRASAAVIGVSYVTLFYWRHKLMRSLISLSKNELVGDLEADDTFLGYSEKGSKKILGREPKKSGTKYYIVDKEKVFLLVAADHSDHLLLKASSSKTTCVNLVNKALGDIVTEKTVLCSNTKTFYKFFANIKGIKHHYRISINNRTENNNIDLAYGCRRSLQAWLDKFKGIASKYLNNYLSLYNCLRKNNFQKTQVGINNFFEALKNINIKESYRSVKTSKLI